MKSLSTEELSVKMKRNTGRCNTCEELNIACCAKLSFFIGNMSIALQLMW